MKISTKFFIWAILIISTCLLFWTSVMGLPNSVAYISDGLNIILLLFTLRKINWQLYIPRITRTPLYCIILFFLIGSVSALIHGVSGTLYLWGIRNIFRYIIFSISVISLINLDDVLKFMRVVVGLYWINACVCLIQFFAFGYRADYVGGIFGVVQGCNGVLSVFINFVLAYVLSQYLSNKTSFTYLVVTVISYFVVVALSETKGNFIFFILIVALEVMIAKKNLKTFTIVLGSVLAIILGLQALSYFFPGAVDILLDFEKAQQYMDATFYGRVTFTRNGMFAVANEYFFKDNWLLNTIGYGMGACEHSVYFTSDFFRMYGNMHYRNYGMAMILLETGYLGLVVYCLIFFALFLFAQKLKRIVSDELNTILLAAQAYTIFALAFTYYGYTMLADAGYFAWFVMTIPFIVLKDYNAKIGEYK